MRLRGCLTALVTPFSDDGSVDEAALRAFVEWQIASGVHGLVPVGSTGEAAKRFRAAGGFDAHLVETHHAAKKDAPSGTARRIQEIAGDLAVTSVRLGHVPGSHALTFDAPYEQVSLIHEARDRRVFADGALLAAKWMIGRRGVFTLDDMLRS